MNFSRNQLIMIGIGGATAIFFALVFAGIIPGLRINPRSQAPNITLGVFGTENEAAFAPIIASYNQIRPNVTVKYTRVDEAGYDQALLAALASGSGPDVFFMKNSQALQYRSLLAPIPASVLSPSQFERLFPSVAKKDFIGEEGIYAMPLYVDTLALFYNKDIFDAKGVALPPKNWTELQDAVSQITDVDDQGQIKTAGVALGGSGKSIAHVSDILSLVMLQLGVPLPSLTNAHNAVLFYLRFSDSSKGAYSWNDSLPNSLDAFAQGKAGMVFGYARDREKLSGKNPYLNYGIAPMVQFENAPAPVNFASYQGLAVSRQSRNAAWAWDFAVNVSTSPQIAAQYGSAVEKPPALRDLIAQVKLDDVLSVFAKQSLSAQSVAPKDDAVYRSALSNMVASVLSGRLTLSAALSEASAAIGAGQ